MMANEKYVRAKKRTNAVKDNHWSKNFITKLEVSKKISKKKKGKPPWNKGKKGVQVAWNKGLTKETDERVAKYSKSLIGHKSTEDRNKKISESNSKSWRKKYKNGYISNMLGKFHSKQTRKKMSKSRKNLFKRGYVSPRKNKHSWNLNIPHTKITKQKIREKRKLQILPTKDTTIEVKIQNFLKHLGIEYFTHQYMKIEHGYQCDILIPSKNLVIECDGDYWHKYPIGKDIDRIRTSELIEKGFKVLRLWEFEIVKMNLNKFKGMLKNV